jgi:hypothetical protein
VGDQTLEHEFQESGQYLDTDVVTELADLTLPGEPLAGRGGQLLRPLRPAGAELGIGPQPP